MPVVSANVRLIRYTPAPQELVAMAGKICYSASDIDDLIEGVEAKDQGKYLEKVTSMGHHSLLEHASFTFGIEGVSRSLLAQITRHRIASFSVQSQRYVAVGDDEGFDYVVPPAIEALGEEAATKYAGQMEKIHGWYNEWREALGGDKAANEDARFVLPSAAATRMIVTMNARELTHFFGLRCCNRTQWEIRGVAYKMFELAYAAAGELFKFAGPGCLVGKCPEGKMTCGRAGEVKARFNEMTSKAQAGGKG